QHSGDGGGQPGTVFPGDVDQDEFAQGAAPLRKGRTEGAHSTPSAPDSQDASATCGGPPPVGLSRQMMAFGLDRFHVRVLWQPRRIPYTPATFSPRPGP